MKTLTYNISYPFSFKDVSLQVANFWVNEVLRSKSKKIWLSIIVYNRAKTPIYLFKNIPFNTSNFTDTSVVLKQYFQMNVSNNLYDTLYGITFNYYFEEGNKKPIIRSEYKIKYLLIFVLMLLILVNSVFLLELSELSSNIIDQNLLEVSNKSVNTSVVQTEKQFNVFNPFISMFDKRGVYYPSCFESASFNVTYINEPKETMAGFNIIECVKNHQYATLKKYTASLTDCMSDIGKIILDYKVSV